MNDFRNRLVALPVTLALWLSGVSGCTASSTTPLGTPTVKGAPIDAPAKTYQRPVAPTDPASRKAMSAEAPPPLLKDGYTGIDFQRLAGFPYLTNDDGALVPGQQIPKDILELDGKQVAVSGFLVPIEYKDDKVSGLILVRNQLLCCFGEEPKLNEWVLVAIDPPVDANMDVPVTLFGRLEVSPDIEEGQVISLYRLSATKMENSKP